MDKFERYARNNPIEGVAISMGFEVKKKKMKCPFHDDKTPSFSFFTSSDGVQLGNCFGCGWKGNSVMFIAEITGKSRSQVVKGLDGEVTPLGGFDLSQIPDPEPEFKPLSITEDMMVTWFDNLTLNHEPYPLINNMSPNDWLLRRGVDFVAIKRNGLGFSNHVPGITKKKQYPMITIPNWGFLPDGSQGWVSVEVRHLTFKKDQDFPHKYMLTGTRQLWQLPQFFEDVERVGVLVETCFDAIAINRFFDRNIATAIPANQFNNFHARQLCNISKLFVFADPGDAGQTHAQKVKSLIRSCEIINLDCDIGDMITHYPDKTHTLFIDLFGEDYHESQYTPF